MAKLPNLYKLSGDGIRITYSTSSVDGNPHLQYQDAHQSRLFMGNQIHSAPTPIGTLVSVILQIIADGPMMTFALLLPRTNLGMADTAQIKTDGITTLHEASFIGPPHGQTDFYTIHPLQGTAAFVFF
jgi:hypothetical protein